MIKDILRDKCGMKEDFIIERAHRLRRKKGRDVIGTQTAKNRALIVRFLDFNVKEKVKKKLLLN